MGSVSLKIGDGTARFKRATICSSAVNGLMLFSVLTTNLFALYAFTWTPHASQSSTTYTHLNHKNMPLISEQVSLIIKEIESSQKKLAQMEKDLLGYESIHLSTPNTPPELKTFLQAHVLPLGKDSRSGITHMQASVGHSCSKSLDLLSQYMVGYKVNGQCPDDWSIAQKLILRGCEPLPRRRCFAHTLSTKVSNLHPFPTSLWKPVADKVVRWTGLSCKNFTCLNSINKFKLTRDFDMVNGNNNHMFVKPKSKNDFSIDDVLSVGGSLSSSIRIGLDVAGSTVGSSGTFAARMAEHNVTVLTQTLNVDAPSNDFIAARGLFPLFMSLDHRFPFYDNFFDLVHAGSAALDVGGGGGNKPQKLEFLLFDIDRVLRAGGLFWLDNVYCATDDRKRDFTRLIERFGYKKLKWVIGEKVLVSAKSEVYLSAVLQKPVRA